MKQVKMAVTLISVLSVAGCFGFSAAAAMPDGVWDGSYDFRNNRNYVLNERAVVEGDFYIPTDTVLTVNEGGELVISEEGSVNVSGGINLKRGGKLFLDGNLYIAQEGSLSISGEGYAEGGSELMVQGGVEVKPEGLLQIESRASFDADSLTVSEGRFVQKRGSSLSSEGRIVIRSGGQLVTNGETNISEGGVLESVGAVVVERKGKINVSGKADLNEGGTLKLAGELTAQDGGVINDLSEHLDLSIYTAEILKNEEDMSLRGIDVSWVQGDIDWEAVSKSGIDFAYIRAGRGDIDGEGPKEDTHFFRNIQGANRYGIDVGVYFYSYAQTPEEAEKEADLLLSLLRGHTVTYPVVYDMEEDVSGLSGDEIEAIAVAFMETIADGGYYPMLYSYRNGIDANFDNDIKNKYALWLAQLKNRPDTDYNYYIWQYSHEGRINGIEGDVDFNISYRDFPDILKDYGLNHLPSED